MKLLLDTHAFIWWDVAPQQLGAQARAACFAPGNELVLSVASVWEMQIKVMLGKLTLRKPLRQLISDQVEQNGLIRGHGSFGTCAASGCPACAPQGSFRPAPGCPGAGGRLAGGQP